MASCWSHDSRKASCHLLNSPVQTDANTDRPYTYARLYIGLRHHHLEDPPGSSTNNTNSYLGHLHSDIFLFPALRCCEGLLYIQVQYYILGARLLVLWSSSARTAREREPHMLIRRQPLSKLSNLFPFHLTNNFSQVYYESSLVNQLSSYTLNTDMNTSSLHPFLLKPTSDKLWCIPKAGSSLSSLGH